MIRAPKLFSCAHTVSQRHMKKKPTPRGEKKIKMNGPCNKSQKGSRGLKGESEKKKSFNTYTHKGDRKENFVEKAKRRNNVREKRPKFFNHLFTKR